MPTDLTQLLPPEGTKILIVLFLSFLVGLEREEHKAGADHYSFGGVRTFPLIGLLGYAAALLSGSQLWLVTAGFLVVGAFMLVAYRHKIASSGMAGATSEMSALVTYLVGALVFFDYFWVATTLAVMSLLLLELKAGLESLATRTAPDEILTFTKFLLLTAVILPVLPDRTFGPFDINPFRAWLVVVAVSGVSYGSYVLQRVTKQAGGVLLVGLLGGAYSSTVTTVALARRARQEERPHLFAGGILVASGVMYLRLAVLLAIFSRPLLALLGPWFAGLALSAALAGWLWSRLPDTRSQEVKRQYQPKNPLELGTALLFAALFVVMVIATRLAVTYLGRAGVFALAAIMGVVDVDPFVLGIAQSAGTATPLVLAASAILVTSACNNIVKGIYAYSFADHQTGVQGLIALFLLAASGLLPLAWLG
jgi:uncharacterized membrane protein (DUF4010 family)